MEGVGRPRVNRAGTPVISLTFSVQRLKAYTEYAEKLGDDNITIDIGQSGFVAGEKSKKPGETFHSYVIRHWSKKK